MLFSKTEKNFTVTQDSEKHGLGKDVLENLKDHE